MLAPLAAACSLSELVARRTRPRGTEPHHALCSARPVCLPASARHHTARISDHAAPRGHPGLRAFGQGGGAE
eukprot:scaffold27838_cov69-Phaeocystis_antarctica.AAC.2